MALIYHTMLLIKTCLNNILTLAKKKKNNHKRHKRWKLKLLHLYVSKKILPQIYSLY